MNVMGIIPARLESTRLPRKLLLAETGLPLLQHTWSAAKKAQSLDGVIVAVDCQELATMVTAFGGDCEVTGEHSSGTDRVAEVARRRCNDAEIIVNIQGDEPELNPVDIDTAVNAMAEHPEWHMATLVTPITHRNALDSPHVVKAVCAMDGRALYFSRSPVPFVRDHADVEAILSGSAPWMQHIGLYVFRRHFLLELTKLPQSPLEMCEKLEQLRALEFGAVIGTVEVDEAPIGIDTRDDYRHFVARHAELTAG